MTIAPVPQKVIVCDVDEVVANMLPEWVRRYNAAYDDNLHVNQIHDWDLTLYVRPSCGKKIYDFLNAPDLYVNVHPVTDALDGVTALRTRGYRVLFVTSATKGHAGQKLQWLQDHGFLPNGRQTDPDYFECSDKSMVRGDLIIDDRPLNLETFPAPGILFPCAHNTRCAILDATYIRRVAGWWQIPDLVDEMLRPDNGTAQPSPPPPVTWTVSDGTKPSNPKDMIGSNKLPLHLWPATATALGCLGFLDGMLKYGRTNFREMGVRASIYIDACKRHLDAWFEGEDCAEDSEIPHLAHALACIAIIVDAQAVGKLEDDRMFNGAGYLSLVKELTPHVARLKAAHAGKNPKHYTIRDNAPTALARVEEA